jgi:hypothetical protein
VFSLSGAARRHQAKNEQNLRLLAALPAQLHLRKPRK